MHDKLLDHETLVKRLAAARKRNVAVPAGKFAYDEAISFDDDDEQQQQQQPQAGGGDDDDDDVFDLSDLLKADAPGGAGQRSGGGTGGGASKGKGGGAAVASGAAEGEASGAGLGVEEEEVVPEEEDEEALDQKVIASRQQIKTWLRALEEGQAQTSHVLAGVGGGRSGIGIGGGRGPKGPAAAIAALPPVRPPPKAKQSSFSARLRSSTTQWSQKTLK